MTDARTSIPCNSDTLERLKPFKPDGKTWEDFMADVADMLEDDVDPEHVLESDVDAADVMNEVRKLREEVDKVPERSASRVSSEISTF